VTNQAPTSSANRDRALLVHAYLDGELDVAAALAARQQIDEDPRLKAELTATSALQAKLRETFPREPAPLTLRSRISKIVGMQRSWARPTWMAMAASIFLASVLSGSSTWLAMRTAAGDQVRAEMVDSHMRALLAQRPTDVNSSERHTVKPWFNSRLPEAPRVADLSSEGFPLMGARIDVVAGSPVPTLVYGRRLHVISLTAVTSGNSVPASATSSSVKGYNIISWTDGQRTFWAASDLNLRELEEFAKLFRSSSG
jgi:anti-sigma factor RsiW